MAYKKNQCGAAVSRADEARQNAKIKQQEDASASFEWKHLPNTMADDSLVENEYSTVGTGSHPPAWENLQPDAMGMRASIAAGWQAVGAGGTAR